MRLFDIKRASGYDGPGLRTVLFFKGCPLRCVWCHNPESYSASPQIAFDGEKCILCRACESVCDKNCHGFSGETHVFSDKNCDLCGKCLSVCQGRALHRYGFDMTPAEALREILRDKSYFGASGGATFSGGEPMMQSREALTLAKMLRSEGISLCIETSGYAESKDFLEISEYTDIFLFDVKCRPEIHKRFTGCESDLILKNLRLLDSAGAKIILRCPIIPDINLDDRHFEFIASLANELGGVCEINLEAYHPAGLSKRRAIGLSAGYENPDFLEKKLLAPFTQKLRDLTGKTVKTV